MAFEIIKNLYTYLLTYLLPFDIDLSIRIVSQASCRLSSAVTPTFSSRGGRFYIPTTTKNCR